MPWRNHSAPRAAAESAIRDGLGVVVTNSRFGGLQVRGLSKAHRVIADLSEADVADRMEKASDQARSVAVINRGLLV